MRNILSAILAIILIFLGLLFLLDNENTTRESIKEENGKIIIIHKKIKVKRISETIDPDYKNKYNLNYY
jgi:hypothetical protein